MRLRRIFNEDNGLLYREDFDRFFVAYSVALSVPLTPDYNTLRSDVVS
jgi:hypothetical protein